MDIDNHIQEGTMVGSGRYTRIAPETGRARGFAKSPSRPTPPPDDDEAEDDDLEPDEDITDEPQATRRRPGRKPGEPQKKREPPRLPTAEERAAIEKREHGRVIEATPITNTIPRKRLKW